ncbi:flavodoxin family protein [Candidatus Dojkabacteria bacterium]|nr:flavodoxin family protein [Candidatus Dojkabacteria bacterium]
MQIVYASTSGNVEVVVEKVSEVLTEKGIVNRLHRSEQTSIDLIRNNSLFVLATSTWEHGEINPFFNKLLAKIKKEDLSRKNAAFIGLGDMRYEPILFNQGIKILKDVWMDKGGGILHELLLINGEPYGILDSRVSKWALGLAEDIRKNDKQ